MEKRAHADRCQKLPDPLPEEAGSSSSPASCLFFLATTADALVNRADLMIEAKDKEQAVFHLFRIYGLHPTIHGSHPPLWPSSQPALDRLSSFADDLRPPAEEETKQTARTAGKAAAKERKRVKEEAKEAAALSAGTTSADETATDGTEGTLGDNGETDGTLPPSSPHAANVELEGLSPAKAKKLFVEGGIAPLPEGLDAEGQSYCPPVAAKKTPKKRAPKVKKEDTAEGEGEKPVKAKTPRKRKSAAADEGADGEDVKPKRVRKTPVKKAAKKKDGEESAASTVATTDESAGEAGDEATPAKKPKHKHHHHHHEKTGEEDVKPTTLEVGGLEEVAMEVAKE
jgi:hypothetical protein